MVAVGICPFAEQVVGVTSQNPGNQTPGFDRVGFCDHTAGGYLSTMRDAGFWNRSQVSAHFVIGMDGTILQLVNIWDTAWAQGRLGPKVVWPPYTTQRGNTGTSNPNAWLVSTEHEDKAVTNQVWPDTMYQADLRVKRWCVEEVAKQGYNLLKYGQDSLAGHFQFDGVNRPYCPGTNWPQVRLFADLAAHGGPIAMPDGYEVKGEPPFVVVYVQGVGVLRIGDANSQYPGQIAKLVGDKYLWLVGAAEAYSTGQPSPAMWSPTPGD